MVTVRRLLMAFLMICFLGAKARCEDAVPTTQADAGGLETCLAAAADDTPIYHSDHFPRAREMNATFRLGDAHGGELEFSWIAVDVGAAAPANLTIAGGTLDIHDKTSGLLSLTGMEQPMPIGKYRLDVSIDHHPWKSRDFSIVAPLNAPDVGTPRDMMPLTPGRKWIYRFVQETAGGVTKSGPGIKIDPDGKLRAKVEVLQAGDEDKGSHLELRRNGNLVFNEWWRLGKDGLIATQRKTTDQLFPLQPAQVLWPWPLQEMTWTYQPDDHSYQQTCRMWGPVPVEGPNGEVPGYVVRIVQADGLSKMTVERHFIPAIGLAREIIISTFNGKLIGRTEMTLEKME